jgi:hypothetical protein
MNYVDETISLSRQKNEHQFGRCVRVGFGTSSISGVQENLYDRIIVRVCHDRRLENRSEDK